MWRRAEGTQPVLQSSQVARTEIQGMPHRHRPAQWPSGFVLSSEAKRESEHTSILPILSTCENIGSNAGIGSIVRMNTNSWSCFCLQSPVWLGDCVWVSLHRSRESRHVSVQGSLRDPEEAHRPTARVWALPCGF